jgi:hemolysin activation/secretion protein
MAMAAWLVAGAALSNADTRLAGVVFDGVSAYTPEALLPLYRPRLGQTVGGEFERELEDAVRSRYTADGYLTPAVTTAATHGASGVLIVRVDEPAVRKVNIVGREFATNPRFWTELAALTREEPLRRRAFDEWLDRMNDLGGIVVQGSIVPIESGAAGYTMDLRVSPSRWSGIVAIDNRAPDLLGNELAQAQVGYRFGDRRPTLLRAAAAVAIDTDRLRFGSLAGTHTFNDLGSAFDWSYSASTSRLPTIAADGSTTTDDYERSRSTIGARSPLRKSATLRVDAWSTLQLYDVETFDEAGERLRTERLRSIEIGSSLTALGGARRRHDASFSITRGLDAFDAEIVEPGRSDGAELDYTTYELAYRLTQPFLDTWTLSVALQGQATGDRLPVSERFLIGGRQLGGAFDPASVTGDQGIGGRVEVARRMHVPFVPVPVEPYVYYDHGASFPNDSDYRDDRAASVGTGIRATIGKISTYVELAQPVIEPDSNPLADEGMRVFVSFSQRFF